MIWLWRILRGIKFTLLSLLVLFLTLLALVSAIVATERGTRLTINLVADRVPMLELGYIEGNMLTGLDVSYLDYRFEDQQYRVESLSFRWQPLALLYNTVSVQSLSAGSVLLVLPQGEDEAEPRAEDWEWPSLALPVRIELGGIEIRDIRIVAGEQVTELEQVTGSLSHGTFNMRIHDLTVVAPDFEVEANGRIGLRYPYSHDLSVDWSYRLPLEDEVLSLAGHGDLSGDIELLGLRHQLTAPVALDAEIRFAPHLDDADQDPYLELEGHWEDLSPPAQFWPLEQPAPVSTARLMLTGWLDDYRLQLVGDVRQEGLPPLDLDLSASGDLTRARIEELLLGLDGAMLRVNGDLAWAEPATDQQFQWDINLALDEFQTREWLEDWPGEIRLEARTQGHIGEEGIDAAVQDLALDGQLRGLMLSGRGDISYSNELLSATGFRVSLGANQLSLDGSLGDSFDLRWNLVAPILEQLDPSLGGSLLAEGQLAGDLAQPELQLALSAGNLRWQEYQVEQLSLVAEESGGHYEISGEANDLTLAGQALSRITLSGVGSLTQHRVKTRVISEELGEVTLALAGGYQDAQWQGAVDALDIRPLEQPRAWLLRNQGLTLGAEVVALQDLCLTTWSGRRRPQAEDSDTVPETASEDPPVAASPQEQPALCADGDWSPAEGLSLVAELSALPLGLFQSELKPEASLAGTLEGRLRVRQEAGQNLHANLNLETRGGEFRYQYGDEDIDIYAWQRAELTAGWIDNRLEANFVTEMEGYGSANAALNLNTDTRTLAGEVRAYFSNLAPLEALVPRLHEVSGELNADVRLGGTLDDPRVVGSINLSDATAALPELGLELEQIALSLMSDEQGRITLSGQVVSEPGRLTLSAEGSNLGDANWQVSARVEGEDFQVIQTRPLQARLSPAITAQASAQEIRIEGVARIPHGLADIKTLPATAVRTSDDIILVSGTDDDEREVLGIPLHLNLRLQLGDDVRFQGFGLESRLSGSMTLLHSPTRGMLTTGEVGVAEGVYKAYGQDLSIERGRLIFQGPYDNPGLDIRAERTITGGGEEIVVGLEIGGTLQRPRSRIFSNPTQSDSDAMAMLLTGRPLSGSSNADASMLVNAIGTLGLERSNFITAEIAQTFGLDEFTVQTGDNLEESSLFIGKYITPRLFVRYVVGLFDQANSVGVRYQLTESLRLEAESGTQQSVDMIYKFER